MKPNLIILVVSTTASYLLNDLDNHNNLFTLTQAKMSVGLKRFDFNTKIESALQMGQNISMALTSCMRLASMQLVVMASSK